MTELQKTAEKVRKCDFSFFFSEKKTPKTGFEVEEKWGHSRGGGSSTFPRCNFCFLAHSSVFCQSCTLIQFSLDRYRLIRRSGSGFLMRPTAAVFVIQVSLGQ